VSSTSFASSQHQQRRGFLLRTLHQWHWISAAICMMGMLLFSITGITLNHAGQIEAQAKVTTIHDTLPSALLAELTLQHEGNAPLPAAVREWLHRTHAIDSRGREAEWSEDEIYLSMPGPGRDAWLSIQKTDGALEYEQSKRGTVAYLNDLHKGRNTGSAWSLFIDLFALSSVVFTLSGLLLLYLHAQQRRATWPLVTLGLLIPLILALLFIH
jgi:uncharacterized protein